MFSKSKSWMSGGVWRPKNPHSLEHLKYLHGVLCKNQTVTDQNFGLLIETLRSISEILIWGDQNDGSVFDFFLEKNMLVFFLRFMRQKSGRQICVQLLQTLNILFENITNETSVYYLLSNNHINSIIVHKFDFSDEEVMAYYISFLKTLSLKLNKHTIHFFYNEHTNDFALYTEAIKFFNHSESMVRIAVRTITLNVYRVDDRCMLRYIRDKTAAPYFSNLVWFIGNHVLELDACVQEDIDHNSRSRLADLVAEHLDHLHYVNDILCLDIVALNDVLTEHLLNRLLLPLYVYSMLDETKKTSAVEEQPSISSVVSLFLLSQVFLIIHYTPLVNQLAEIIFNGELDMNTTQHDVDSGNICGFVKPTEPLAATLESSGVEHTYEEYEEAGVEEAEEKETIKSDECGTQSDVPAITSVEELAVTEDDWRPLKPVDSGSKNPSQLNANSTDEEKLRLNSVLTSSRTVSCDVLGRPYLSAICQALDCIDGDYKALFALCLLFAISHNRGVNQELLEGIQMPTDLSETKQHYNTAIVQRLINIMSLAAQSGSKVRLVTLELSILLLKSMVFNATDGCSFLQDLHLAAVEGAREEATLQMRNFYKIWEKSEEIFLDMFEDEYRELMIRPLNVEYLTMDASVLLPPTGTPLTGIDFNRRLPCGEVERAKKAIRVFFLLRSLSFTLRQELEIQLPLTREEECVKVDDVLDLNNSDLIACTIIGKDSNKKDRRFLVIDIIQLILVEPDSKRLGWGVVRFVGFLQDVEVSGDKDDSRCLHVTVLRPTSIAGGPAAASRPPPRPLLAARFVFDDHIRCMAARQRLVKGRLRSRQRKMQMIARLLEFPSGVADSSYRPTSAAATAHRTMAAGSVSPAIPGRSHMIQKPPSSEADISPDVQQSVFASVEHVAAFHTVLAREQEQEHQRKRAPRVVQSPVASASKLTSVTSKKKKVPTATLR